MRELRGRIRANGTELYHEIHGNGPPVLFISGATGDAGHFMHVAQVLGDDFTVIAYDRRGNSRSSRPDGWTETSITEQADDAAALLQALAVTPAVVFGTSGGGTILMELISRHPAALKGAIAHEPVLAPVSPSAAEVGLQLQRMIEDGFANGGPRAAQELFLRWAGTDEVFEAMDRDLRERMLNNGDVFFGLEVQQFRSYVPDVEAIKRVPIVAAGGVENRGTSMVEGTDWLGRELGCEVVWVPGHHAPYWHPGQSKPFADALRPSLRMLAA